MFLSDGTPWKAVQCPCGQAGCRSWGLNYGTFHQGTGWDRETAEFVADAVNAAVSRMLDTEE